MPSSPAQSSHLSDLGHFLVFPQEPLSKQIPVLLWPAPSCQLQVFSASHTKVAWGWGSSAMEGPGIEQNRWVKARGLRYHHPQWDLGTPKGVRSSNGGTSSCWTISTGKHSAQSMLVHDSRSQSENSRAKKSPQNVLSHSFHFKRSGDQASGKWGDLLSLSLTHLGSCWDTEPTSSFLGRGPDQPQAANWAWAAFPSRGTTKNSMQATQIPGSCQPHLSPDLVAWAASLPTPCSHLELSSLSLQSFQTQQGLSGSTLACQEGLQPSRAPPGAESWPGRQTQLAFGYPQGRVCSTLAVSPAQPPLSESPLHLGLPHPPGLIVALSMEPLLPWSVTYSFAVPSSLPFCITKYSSAVSPFNLHLQVPVAPCVLCITDFVLCFTLRSLFLTVSCHCDLVSVICTSESSSLSEQTCCLVNEEKRWTEGWMNGYWMDDACQFSSVAQSCPTPWDPMDCSTSGLPVHNQLPEFTQTHVHWVSDAIQPSHPLLSPSPPTFNFSQHQGLFKWISTLHQVAKVLAFQLQHQSFLWIFKTDFLYDGLVRSPCSPRDSQESSPPPQVKRLNS